jgi:RHS repeat-associated protein
VKKSNGTLYWGSGPLAESDLSGTMQREYLSFGGKRIARLDIPSGTAPTASNAHYYFSDHLGSSNVVTDSAGTMRPCTNSPVAYTSVATGEEESDFMPYGREMQLCDAAPQHFKFTGKERDTESGLDHFDKRHDSSSLGRFITPDPVTISRQIIDPQTLNKYSYAFNRPTILIDPDGRWPTWYHHTIIQDTFGNLGSHSVAVLEAASDWVDSVTAGNQAPERSFMHAMSDGEHHQSVAEAERLTNDYISSEVKAAVDEQIRFESGGGKGNSDAALTRFGHALHTVTDRTSPEHAGYQPWYCLVCASAYDHKNKEERSSKSSDSADMEARYEAHVEAAALWRKYQDDLIKERKRRCDLTK